MNDVELLQRFEPIVRYTSGALTLLALALLVTLHPPDWPEWIVVVLLIFAGIEATTRAVSRISF